MGTFEGGLEEWFKDAFEKGYYGFFKGDGFHLIPIAEVDLTTPDGN